MGGSPAANRSCLQEAPPLRQPARLSGEAAARFPVMKIAVRKRRAPSIIIVSLIDILTILLIFFVVSTTFKRDQPEVQINLPDSKTASKTSSELERALVSVNENDEVRLDGEVIAAEELETAVRNLPASRRASLALQADKKASFGTIIKVMDALKLAGVKNLPAFTRGEK